MSSYVRRWLIAFTVSAVAALSATVATATGSLSGPCSASLAGTSVAERGTGATASPIVIANDATVPIVMSASGKLTHVTISLEFAGISWVVRDKAVTTPVYRDSIPIKDYARYGVGLYKVSGTGTGPGFSCSGATLVRVKGNPLTTVLGGGAAAAAVLGAAGLLLTGMGARSGIAPSRIVRGLLSGLLGALGVLVLLQEAAVLYPTLLVAVVALVTGAAVGMAAGTVPGLLHLTPRGTGAADRPFLPTS